MSAPFLPIVPSRGHETDVVLVTGDAYVDHPSFGAALLGRWLESHGMSVGIVAQPDWHGPEDVGRFGKPRLFFGVTAGAVDSMVATYTALGARRKRDRYSEDGVAGRRPERATVAYTGRIRQAVKGAFVVLGGIEASTRRFAHYDVWSDKVRRSVLLDAKADLLLYGMAEETILAVADWRRRGGVLEERQFLGGVVFAMGVRDRGQLPDDAVWLPSFEEVASDKAAFMEAHRLLTRHGSRRVVVQPHGDRLVVQTPSPPMASETLSAIAALPFTRRAHPSYRAPIPALAPVKTSLVTHRGCVGRCTFCVLALHQGSRIVSRAHDAVLAEARAVAAMDDFDGTITDVGGPSVNMYQLGCRVHGVAGSCAHKGCLFPEPCPDLVVDHRPAMALIRAIKAIPRVRHVYVGSGIRYDLVLRDPAYLDFLVREDLIGGQLSVAPEHVSDKVLRLMGKPPSRVYRAFEELFEEVRTRHRAPLHLVPYFITAFPGATLDDAFLLARRMAKRGTYPEQIQDFTAIPMADATAMYWTGTTLEGRPIPVSRSREARLMHRALVQHANDRYKKQAKKALQLLGETWRELTAR